MFLKLLPILAFVINFNTNARESAIEAIDTKNLSIDKSVEKLFRYVTNKIPINKS